MTWRKVWTIVAVLMFIFGGIIAGCAVAAEPSRACVVWGAEWCNPCKRMEPYIADLYREGWAVTHLDIDKEPAKAATYGVQGLPIPCVTVIDCDTEQVRVLTRESGYRDKEGLKTFMRTWQVKHREDQ